MKFNNVLYAIFSILVLSVPILYLIGVIQENVAFPLIFALLGVLILWSELKKRFEGSSSNIWTITVGIGLIIFALVVVIPTYLK